MVLIKIKNLKYRCDGCINGCIIQSNVKLEYRKTSIIDLDIYKQKIIKNCKKKIISSTI